MILNTILMYTSITKSEYLDLAFTGCETSVYDNKFVNITYLNCTDNNKLLKIIK